MHKLPNRAQLSSINDLAEIKYLNDRPAFIVAGNFYSPEVETPRCDASIGLILTFDAHGEVNAISPAQSNLLIKGEVKAIEKIKLASGKEAFLFAINDGALKLIEPVFKP